MRRMEVKLLNEKSPSASNSTALPTGCFSLPPDFSTMISPLCSFRFVYCLSSTSRYSILSYRRVKSLLKLAFRITPTLINGSFLPFHNPLIVLQISPNDFFLQWGWGVRRRERVDWKSCWAERSSCSVLRRRMSILSKAASKRATIASCSDNGGTGIVINEISFLLMVGKTAPSLPVILSWIATI